MDNTIGLKVEVDSKQAAKSLGQLEQEFESLNEQIRQVPVNSKEFKELNKQIAQSGREIKNLELSMESLDNEQVASELGSVAGAVGDVSAAFILLGDDSETMQEVAKNIELAMGLSMGLKGAIEGVSSANKLLTNSTLAQNTVERIGNFIKVGSAVTNAQLAASEVARAGATGAATAATTASTGAMKLFRLALMGLGIGLIIVAVMALVENFDKVKNAIYGVADAIYQYFKPQIDMVIAALQYLGLIESEEEKKRAALYVKNEKMIKDNYSKVSKLIKAKIELLKEELEEERKNQNEKVALIDWEIQKRQAAGKDISNLEKEKLQLLIDGTKKEIELKQQIIHAQFQENAARTQANIEIAKLNGQNTKSLEIELQKQRELGRTFRDEELDALMANLDQQSKALELFEIKQTKLQIDAAKERAEEKKKLYEENVIEDAKRRATANIELVEEEKNAYLDYMDLIRQVAQEEKQLQDQAEQDRRDKRDNQIQQSADLAGSLISLNNSVLEMQLAGAHGNEAKMEQIRKKAFERDKKLRLAQAIILGVQSVMTAATAPFPLSIPMAIIAGVAAVANIVKIARSTYAGSGGGGSVPSGLGNTGNAVGGAKIPQVTNTTTTIGEPTKVYVTEQDISDTQYKVGVQEKLATI